jgi:hypothetical protein
LLEGEFCRDRSERELEVSEGGREMLRTIALQSLIVQEFGPDCLARQRDPMDRRQVPPYELQRFVNAAVRFLALLLYGYARAASLRYWLRLPPKGPAYP